MNQTNYLKKEVSITLLRSIIMSVLFLVSLGILIMYFVLSHFGGINDAFMYTIPFYIILLVLSAFPKLKMSWAPVSLFLYSIYCLFNTYFDSSIYPQHNILIILLGVSVLLDFINFTIDFNPNSKVISLIKKIISLIILSIFIVSGSFLIFTLFVDQMKLTPFGDLLKTIYIPFSIIIILIGFIYYSYHILKTDNIISERKVSIINSIILGLSFAFTIVMMFLSF